MSATDSVSDYYCLYFFLVVVKTVVNMVVVPVIRCSLEFVYGRMAKKTAAERWTRRRLYNLNVLYSVAESHTFVRALIIIALIISAKCRTSSHIQLSDIKIFGYWQSLRGFPRVLVR